MVAPSLLAQYVVWLFVQRDRAFETLSKANLGFAIGLIRALEAADAYTAGHSAAVAVYARDVARELGYSESDAAIIQLAALLHDVGKIGVPTEVLRKPSRLDEDEWRLIQQHPITGERIVGEIPRLPLHRGRDPPPPRAPRRHRLPRRHGRAERSRARRW